MQSHFIDSFVAVVECGSMAEAARRLQLTPTALALRVQALEAGFGHALLVRSGRTVRPTEHGMRLAAAAPAFQKALRDLRTAVAGDDAPGSLRLGSIATALSGWLPQRLGAVRRLHPRLDLQLDAGVSRDLYHRVQRDQLDVALIVMPPFELPKSLLWRTVRREPLVLLAHRRHAGGDPLALLAAQPLIRYDRNNWGGTLSDQYLQARGVRPRESMELDALDALQVLVGLDLGVSVVPDWARAAPLPDELVALPLPDALHREVGLLWPSGSAHGRILDLLA